MENIPKDAKKSCTPCGNNPCVAYIIMEQTPVAPPAVNWCGKMNNCHASAYTNNANAMVINSLASLKIRFLSIIIRYLRFCLVLQLPF